LSQNKGRSWGCEQCKNKPGLRQLRGNCGESFKKGLPYLDQDELGFFIPGYRVAPNCNAEYADLKIRSCPVALSNLIAPITQAYFRQVNGLFNLKDVYPSPSCAIVEAIDLLHYHYQELKNKIAQDAIEDRKNG
jgi:hypothetical protein